MAPETFSIIVRGKHAAEGGLPSVAISAEFGITPGLSATLPSPDQVRVARDPGATPTVRPIPLATASSASYSEDHLLIGCAHGYQCIRLSLSTGYRVAEWGESNHAPRDTNNCDENPAHTQPETLPVESGCSCCVLGVDQRGATSRQSESGQGRESGRHALAELQRLPEQCAGVLRARRLRSSLGPWLATAAAGPGANRT